MLDALSLINWNSNFQMSVFADCKSLSSPLPLVWSCQITILSLCDEVVYVAELIPPPFF